MTPLKVFVASSTESEQIARQILSSLQTQLEDRAIVELWRDKFAVSETAIESLETIANEADFAVLLMTPDDLTVSRQIESAAPRDNLIFEAGLFVGALGRHRSFLVRERSANLKLPSDILGVTAAIFDARDDTRTTSLQAQCERIVTQINKQGLRPKWLAQGRAALAANGEFCRDVEGAWWERINHPDGSALSYFAIRPDPLTGGVTLEGAGYRGDGEPSALWKSEMVRLYPSERRFVYMWRGTHPLPGFAHLKFHGYGTMEFNLPEDSSTKLASGHGDFWDVDEAQPGNTVSKPIELRRVTDPAVMQNMKVGSADERRARVRAELGNW